MSYYTVGTCNDNEREKQRVYSKASRMTRLQSRWAIQVEIKGEHGVAEMAYSKSKNKRKMG